MATTNYCLTAVRPSAAFTRRKRLRREHMETRIDLSSSCLTPRNAATFGMIPVCRKVASKCMESDGTT
jgi:hypothetical protein